MEYEKKVVVVTGAGGGIGRAVCERFAEAAAVVYALDIARDKLEETVRIINGKKEGKAHAVELNISDESAVDAVFESIEKAEGRIDILVNCAGVLSLGPFSELTGSEWDRVLGINLKGTFLCSKAAALRMIPHKKGAIINISAGAAKTGGMNANAAYVASKGGINSLTLHFAVHLAKHGIRVNCICPGPVDTEMIRAQRNSATTAGGGLNIVNATPLGMGYPEDIAQACLFLASEKKARYITGEILDVNGGLIMD